MEWLEEDGSDVKAMAMMVLHGLELCVMRMPELEFFHSQIE
jgi:hypothetical protein